MSDEVKVVGWCSSCERIVSSDEDLERTAERRPVCPRCGDLIVVSQGESPEDERCENCGEPHDDLLSTEDDVLLCPACRKCLEALAAEDGEENPYV